MTSKLLLTVALGCTVIDLCFSTASAQLAADAWKEPQDTFSSLFEPDRYAWRLFIALNWPANTATKEADAGKAFGADGPVVWETWRNVRPQAPDTVFPVDGSDPGPWLGGAGPVVAQEQQRFDRVLPTQQAVAALAQRRVKPPPPVPSFDGGLGGEVRMNKSTYEFIRAKKLFNVEGQIAQFNAGEVNLNFPPNAKEIKAEWRTIDPSEKPRYHWTEVVRTDGSREVWGLSALHIITKDLPNWFWATFEHIDTKSPNPVGPGWQFPSVDRVACPLPPHGCEQAPTGIGLQGTKWEHYRLRGTQIDFITSSGFPTQLSNSQLEAVQNSSCMTCHAMATIDRDGGTFGFQFIKGSPQPAWFQNAQGQRIFMQQDFVFSLTRASRANPP